jgi:hypothetical protein
MRRCLILETLVATGLQAGGSADWAQLSARLAAPDGGKWDAFSRREGGVRDIKVEGAEDVLRNWQKRNSKSKGTWVTDESDTLDLSGQMKED